MGLLTLLRKLKRNDREARLLVLGKVYYRVMMPRNAFYVWLF